MPTMKSEGRLFSMPPAAEFQTKRRQEKMLEPWLCLHTVNQQLTGNTIDRATKQQIEILKTRCVNRRMQNRPHNQTKWQIYYRNTTKHPEVRMKIQKKSITRKTHSH
jgi:hypothetical protein